MSSPSPPHLFPEATRTSPGRICSICPRFVAGWDDHFRCYQHRTDCSPDNACEICVDWDNNSWSMYVSWCQASEDKEDKRRVAKASTPKGKGSNATRKLLHKGKGKGHKSSSSVGSFLSLNPPLVPISPQVISTKQVINVRREHGQVDELIELMGSCPASSGLGPVVSMPPGASALGGKFGPETDSDPAWPEEVLVKNFNPASGELGGTVHTVPFDSQEIGTAESVDGDSLALLRARHSQLAGPKATRNYPAMSVSGGLLAADAVTELLRSPGTNNLAGATGLTAGGTVPHGMAPAGSQLPQGSMAARAPTATRSAEPDPMENFFNMLTGMMKKFQGQVPPTGPDGNLGQGATFGSYPALDSQRVPLGPPPGFPHLPGAANTTAGHGADGALGPVPLLRIPKRKHTDNSTLLSKHSKLTTSDSDLSSHEDSDRDETDSDENLSIEEDNSLKYPACTALVWDMLKNELPDKKLAADRSVTTKAMSALSGVRLQEPKEPRLPLAGLARSSINAWAEKAKNPEKGALRIGHYPKPTKSRKYESTCSRDFQIGHAELLNTTKLDAGHMQEAEARIPFRTLVSIEEESRRGILAASKKEWHLLTVKHLLDLLQRHMLAVQDKTKVCDVLSVLHVISTCQELLQSIGTLSENVMDKLTFMLNLVTLIRRDQILKKLPQLSAQLLEDLRTIPIVGPEDDNLLGAKPSTSLFAGLEPKITEAKNKLSGTMVRDFFAKMQVKTTASQRREPNVPKTRAPRNEAAKKTKKAKAKKPADSGFADFKKKNSKPKKPKGKKGQGT